MVFISPYHFKGQWFKSCSVYFCGFILCLCKIIVCVENLVHEKIHPYGMATFKQKKSITLHVHAFDFEPDHWPKFRGHSCPKAATGKIGKDQFQNPCTRTYDLEHWLTIYWHVNPLSHHSSVGSLDFYFLFYFIQDILYFKVYLISCLTCLVPLSLYGGLILPSFLLAFDIVVHPSHVSTVGWVL